LNKAVSVIIVIFLVFSFTGISFSAGNAQMNVNAGLVTAINAKERTITLQNDKIPEFICVIDDKAVVRINNGQQSFSGIKIGDIAAVTYKKVDGKNVAIDITVMTPPVSSSQEKAKPATSEEKK